MCKGTEKRVTKRATCVATLLQNELNSDGARFTNAQHRGASIAVDEMKCVR